MVEKNENGVYDHTKSTINKLPQNGEATTKVVGTSRVIASQLGIGKNTVERAAEFTEAVDTVVRVTRVKVNDLLSGKVYPLQSSRIELQPLG